LKYILNFIHEDNKKLVIIQNNKRFNLYPALGSKTVAIASKALLIATSFIYYPNLKARRII